jgi:hypothetical protein
MNSIRRQSIRPYPQGCFQKGNNGLPAIWSNCVCGRGRDRLCGRYEQEKSRPGEFMPAKKCEEVLSQGAKVKLCFAALADEILRDVSKPSESFSLQRRHASRRIQFRQHKPHEAYRLDRIPSLRNTHCRRSGRGVGTLCS